MPGKAVISPSSSVEIPWNKSQSWTLAVQVDPAAPVGTAVKVEASFDDTNFKSPIALQDPTAAVGAAYVTSLGPAAVGLSQDRLFGASRIKLTRTDATAGNANVGFNTSTNG